MADDAGHPNLPFDANPPKVWECPDLTGAPHSFAVFS
jgi:hypothetical protein